MSIFEMTDNNYVEPIDRYKKDRPSDRAFLISDGENTICLDFIGPGLDCWDEADRLRGNTEYSFGTFDPGIWIWEGSYISHRTWEGDYDAWLEGKVRKLTPEELELYYETECPWDPEEWLIPNKEEEEIVWTEKTFPEYNSTEYSTKYKDEIDVLVGAFDYNNLTEAFWICTTKGGNPIVDNGLTVSSMAAGNTENAKAEAIKVAKHLFIFDNLIERNDPYIYWENVKTKEAHTHEAVIEAAKKSNVPVYDEFELNGINLVKRNISDYEGI